MTTSGYFFWQKQTSYEPLTGSITEPSVPDGDSFFRFCVRDSAFSRVDSRRAQAKTRDIIDAVKEQGVKPLGIFMLGSVERGEKLYNFYASYHILLRDKSFPPPKLGSSSAILSGMFIIFSNSLVV